MCHKGDHYVVTSFSLSYLLCKQLFCLHSMSWSYEKKKKNTSLYATIISVVGHNQNKTGSSVEQNVFFFGTAFSCLKGTLKRVR